SVVPNTDELRRVVLQNIKKPNTKMFTQRLDCQSECDPFVDGNRYTLFYSKNGSWLNPKSQDMLKEIISSIISRRKQVYSIESHAVSKPTEKENIKLSEENGQALVKELEK